MTGYSNLMHGYTVSMDDFTARQQRILIELARGSSIKTISAATGLGPRSIRAMITDICIFLGASDTATASRWLIEQLDRAAGDDEIVSRLRSDDVIDS